MQMPRVSNIWNPPLATRLIAPHHTTSACQKHALDPVRFQGSVLNICRNQIPSRTSCASDDSTAWGSFVPFDYRSLRQAAAALLSAAKSISHPAVAAKYIQTAADINERIAELPPDGSEFPESTSDAQPDE